MKRWRLYGFVYIGDSYHWQRSCCVIWRIRDRLEGPTINWSAITFSKNDHCPWGTRNNRRGWVQVASESGNSQWAKHLSGKSADRSSKGTDVTSPIPWHHLLTVSHRTPYSELNCITNFDLAVKPPSHSQYWEYYWRILILWLVILASILSTLVWLSCITTTTWTCLWLSTTNLDVFSVGRGVERWKWCRKNQQSPLYVVLSVFLWILNHRLDVHSLYLML